MYKQPAAPACLSPNVKPFFFQGLGSSPLSALRTGFRPSSVASLPADGSPQSRSPLAHPLLAARQGFLPTQETLQQRRKACLNML